MQNRKNILRMLPSRKVVLNQDLLDIAKPSFNVRHVDLSKAKYLVTKAKPHAGDVVIATIKKMGQHTRIHMNTGRRARMYEGDTVILTYANRYAMDQFEALIPKNLSTCNMVAAGGVASKTISQHSSMKDATVIRPLGLLADENGRIMNTKDWALPDRVIPKDGRKATIIVIVGTEMNAGKTTTASSIIQGAVKAGLRVGSAKVTGTGAAGDYGEMVDAGANCVYDLIDAGYPSTYKLSKDNVLGIFETLTATLLDKGMELIVLELADGILQGETKALMESPEFRNSIDSVVLAACDTLAAKAGVSVLEEMGLPLVAISGKVTGSSIGCESSKAITGYPVFNKKNLIDPAYIPLLFPQLSLSECKKIQL